MLSLSTHIFISHTLHRMFFDLVSKCPEVDSNWKQTGLYHAAEHCKHQFLSCCTCSCKLYSCGLGRQKTANSYNYLVEYTHIFKNKTRRCLNLNSFTRSSWISVPSSEKKLSFNYRSKATYIIISMLYSVHTVYNKNSRLQRINSDEFVPL